MAHVKEVREQFSGISSFLWVLGLELDSKHLYLLSHLTKVFLTFPPSFLPSFSLSFLPSFVPSFLCSFLLFLF